MTRCFQKRLSLSLILSLLLVMTSSHADQTSHKPVNSVTFTSASSVAADDRGDVFIVARTANLILKLSATRQLTIVAGNGTGSFSGDGGPATRASLYFPSAVAIDRAGNLYIADTDNERIRRVSATTGVITTVAGSGDSAFSGDGGPATRASLYSPQGLAVDGSGNLYIADTDNERIGRVDASTHVISTVAGNGDSAFSGDGGPARRASLDAPQGVAVDGSGNLFIADTNNGRIRRVDAATGVITTVAGITVVGNGSASFSGDGEPATEAGLGYPTAVAVDKSGNLFIADTRNNRIRRVDHATGIITTVAGNGMLAFAGDGGPALMASLYFPKGVAADREGNIYIADTDNQRIRCVNASTGIISTVAKGD